MATIRALKYHGGVDLQDLGKEDLAALEKGMANLERHVNNIRNHYGLPCIVAVNHFTLDTDAEIKMLKDKMAAQGAPVVICHHWAEGGKGAEDLARAVVQMVETTPANFKFVYEENETLWNKMNAVATKLYGAKEIMADSRVRAQIRKLEDDGYGSYPICVAKTQYSFSTDPALRGAPSGHSVTLREVRLAAGAEFVVMVCGDVMTMPGLPRIPSSASMDVDSEGRIIGMF